MSTTLPTSALRATTLPFVDDLGRHGRRPALVERDGEVITYAELSDRVDVVARSLAGGRGLVLMTATPDAASITAYLGALRAGHVVLVVPCDRRAALADAYRPDLVLDPADLARPGRDVPPGDGAGLLHPELAVLLGTSGSTGSPKLVRLSHSNLASNARAIATYLGITERDRAATTLPLHYCYGLSVLHSYLTAGASLALTDRSVADDGFWDWFRATGSSSFAGVPYTFELLERVGFEQIELPALRYVTQAGGRMAPERVQHFAEVGRRRGWELVVMYGQTEATARMAYLPPELAAVAPDAVGLPIKGGSFTIEPCPETAAGTKGPTTGELVYHGPNVMLGYATDRSDLGRGRDVEALRTGDIGYCDERGLYHVIGRRSRFAKVFGLRVDLDDVEAILAGRGVAAVVASDDRRLFVATEQRADAAHLRDELAAALRLPPGAVVWQVWDEMPRLTNGKPDVQAMLQADPGAAVASASAPEPRDPVGVVGQLYTRVLGVPVHDHDTFVSLGGDSLSYVEVSLGLEDLLGELPAGWQTVPVGELAAREVARVARSRPRARLEIPTLLRAVGIVVIVAGHLRLTAILGAAHVLLAVAGYNFARFQLAATSVPRYLARHARAVARIAVPSMVWIGIAALLGFGYPAVSVLLVNGLVEGSVWDERWRYWFLEVLVAVLGVLGLLFALPALRRLEEGRPLQVAAASLALALVPRFAGGTDVVHHYYRPTTIAWVFVLGWLIERAKGWAPKFAVTGAVVVTIWGYFGDPSRELVVIAGLLALVWVPWVPVPRVLSRVVGLLAGTSLYIYLTHPQVYPAVRDATSPQLAFVASLAVGVAVGIGALRLIGRAEARLGRSSMHRGRAVPGAPSVEVVQV